MGSSYPRTAFRLEYSLLDGTKKPCRNPKENPCERGCARRRFSKWRLVSSVLLPAILVPFKSEEDPGDEYAKSIKPMGPLQLVSRDNNFQKKNYLLKAIT